MEKRLKTANILSVLLATLCALFFVASIFVTPVYGDSTGDGTNTETTDPSTEVPGDGTDVTPDDEFEAPPKLVTALSAWKYAETKLYELAHWESLTRNHEIRPDKPMSGQTIRSYKYFNGPQDAYGTYSTIFLPGAVIGKESYTYLENKNGILTKRETPHQTSKREPIWEDVKTWTWTEAEYIAINGSLPFMPGYIINSGTVTNGSSRPISDGTKITFTLGLKKSALTNYIMQVKEASQATAGPFFNDGSLSLEVVLNAKTGMYISIRTIEEYNITVLGIPTHVKADRTEEYFNFVKKK